MNLAHHSSKPTKQEFTYTWRTMPRGASKRCPSAIDALTEVLMLELKILTPALVHSYLGVHSSQVSRVRHGTIKQIPSRWLYRAAEFANIPYQELCALVKQEPEIERHHNARKEIQNAA